MRPQGGWRRRKGRRSAAGSARSKGQSRGRGRRRQRRRMGPPMLTLPRIGPPMLRVGSPTPQQTLLCSHRHHHLPVFRQVNMSHLEHLLHQRRRNPTSLLILLRVLCLWLSRRLFQAVLVTPLVPNMQLPSRRHVGPPTLLRFGPPKLGSLGAPRHCPLTLPLVWRSKRLQVGSRRVSKVLQPKSRTLVKAMLQS